MKFPKERIWDKFWESSYLYYPAAGMCSELVKVRKAMDDKGKNMGKWAKINIGDYQAACQFQNWKNTDHQTSPLVFFSIHVDAPHVVIRQLL